MRGCRQVSRLIGAALLGCSFAAMSYEIGEFDVPVNIGNGSYLYDGSIFHFEKDFAPDDLNHDGINDSKTTRYMNDEGHKILKKEAVSNEHEGKIWEWTLLQNYSSRNHQDNYNLTDVDGDGTFEILSQYTEVHPIPSYHLSD